MSDEKSVKRTGNSSSNSARNNNIYINKYGYVMSHFVTLFDAMQLVTIECTQNVYILYYIKELVLYIILGAAVGVVGEHVV